MKWNILRSGYEMSLSFVIPCILWTFWWLTYSLPQRKTSFSVELIIHTRSQYQVVRAFRTKNLSVQLCLCGSQKFIGWREIGGFCCLTSLHSASPMERRRTQIKSMWILPPPFWPDFSTTQRPVMWSTSVAKCWYQQSHSVGFLPFVIVKLQNPILIRKHRFATRIHNILASMLCPFCWDLYWVHSGTPMWFHIWLPRRKGIGEGSMLNQVLNRRICQEKKGRRGTGLEVQGTWTWSWPIFATNYVSPWISHFTFQGTHFLIFNMWQINVFQSVVTQVVDGEINSVNQDQH